MRTGSFDVSAISSSSASHNKSRKSGGQTKILANNYIHGNVSFHMEGPDHKRIHSHISNHPHKQTQKSMIHTHHSKKRDGLINYIPVRKGESNRISPER